MKKTTLCYLEHDGQYLMLYRNKKHNDVNQGKWVGVGGKFEDNETPEQCMLREVYEETGLKVTQWSYRGIVYFVSDTWPDEEMHLFVCTQWEGQQKECDEGELRWISKDRLLDVSMWEGDKIFLKMIDHEIPFFHLKLSYQGDTLVDALCDGSPISWR